MGETLTILGASVRAAAASARRAGLSPYCGDLFADLDLRRICPAVCVGDYPAGLLAVCAGPQPGGWMATGGLENHPRLVERMARVRPLFGNSAQVLRRVRDPHQVAAVLARRGLECPALARTSDRLPRDGTWLRKPRRSAGGLHVAPWTGQDSPWRSLGPWYYQERIDGLACSAVYVGAQGAAVMLGVTRQLTGADWTGATGFHYCGSIGPLRVTPNIEQTLAEIGHCLADEFELTGLFGVDAILTQGAAWPVEINPRYTASIEILERTLSFNAIELHLAACRGQLPAACGLTNPAYRGKAIMHARGRVAVAGHIVELAEGTNQSSAWPLFADIPPAGTIIERGGPILTLLDDAADEGAVERVLRLRAAEFESRFYAPR